jgi:hypothetical protein
MKYGLSTIKEIQKNKYVPQKVVETEAEKAKKLHIQQPKVEEGASPMTGGSKPEVHIHPERTDGGGALSDGGSKPDVHIHAEHTEIIKKDWVTGKEKNDTILLQSVLARSVEVVNAQYRDYPEFGYHDHPFEDLLDTRLNHIENVSDRLFTYIKKKLKEEQP